MRALVVGASGLVGSYLYKFAPGEYNIFGTFKNCCLDKFIPMDITDAKAVNHVVQKIVPELIFLPAAFTNVDSCQENSEMCFKVNVEGARNVAFAAKEAGARIVYFSTDYIFDGKAGPYCEDDLPRPLGVYGRSKFDAEEIIRDMFKEYLIIRTTGVYGWESLGKNFVVNLIKHLKNREYIRVPYDQISTPTYAGNLAKIVWELAGRNKSGIYNVAGDTFISRLDFALLAAKVFNLDKSFILGIKTEEMKRPAERPLKAGLKNGKLKSELGASVKVMTSSEGLLCMRDERV